MKPGTQSSKRAVGSAPLLFALALLPIHAAAQSPGQSQNQSQNQNPDATEPKQETSAEADSEAGSAGMAEAEADHNATTTADGDEVEVLEVRGGGPSERSMENSARALDVVELESQRVRPADMGIVLRQTRGITLRQSGGLGTAAELSLNGLSGQQVPLLSTEFRSN